MSILVLGLASVEAVGVVDSILCLAVAGPAGEAAPVILPDLGAFAGSVRDRQVFVGDGVVLVVSLLFADEASEFFFSRLEEHILPLVERVACVFEAEVLRIAAPMTLVAIAVLEVEPIAQRVLRFIHGINIVAVVGEHHPAVLERADAQARELPHHRFRMDAIHCCFSLVERGLKSTAMKEIL